MKFIDRLKLKDFSAQENYFLWILIIFNAFSALYQTAVTKEISASIMAFRARLHIVFGFASVFYGIGMFIAHKRYAERLTGGNLAFLGVLTGIFTGASLIAILRLNGNAGAPHLLPAITGTILLIAVTLVLFGSIFSAIITYFSRNRKEYIGAVVAYSLAGFAAAFISHALFSVHIGVNSTLVLIAASALLFALCAKARGLTIPLILTAALLFLLYLFPADRYIEKFRNTLQLENKRIAYYGLALSPDELGRLIPIFDGWSAYSKINLYQVEGSSKIVGAYNYYPTWIYDEHPDPYRKLAYQFVRENDRTLCLAMGGGWPLLSLSLKHPENITGVEVDSVVVDFFRKNPRYNNGLFHKINVITAEGRNTLDELDRKFDAILVDMPGSPATLKENPTEFEDYLFTTESLKKYFNLLNPDGILAYYVLYHQVGPACATLYSNNVYFRALLVNVTPGNKKGDSYLVLASRNRARVDEAIEGMLSAPPIIVDGRPKRIHELYDLYSPPDLPALTDDLPSPFGKKRFPPILTTLLKITTFLGTAIFLFSLVTIFFVPKTARDKANMLYFLLIGGGFLLFQYYIYAKFRSYFGDPMTTVIYTTIIFLAAGSVGSALAPYIRPLKRRRVQLAAVTLCIAYTYHMFNHIPFSVTGIALKFLYAALIIAPFGLLSGVFFPMGLLVMKQSDLGWALLMDALGTTLGFTIFYFMYWNYGTSSTFYPMASCYILATLLVLSHGRLAERINEDPR